MAWGTGQLVCLKSSGTCETLSDFWSTSNREVGPEIWDHGFMMSKSRHEHKIGSPHRKQGMSHPADFKVHSMGQYFLNWILILQMESVSAPLIGGWSSSGGVELSCRKEFIWMAMNVTMWWNIETRFSYRQLLALKLRWQNSKAPNWRKLHQSFKKDSDKLLSSITTSAVSMQAMRHKVFGCENVSSHFVKKAEAG